MKKLMIFMLVSLFAMTTLVNCGKSDKKRMTEMDTGRNRAQLVNLDVKAVQEAFKNATDPQKFEEKVNELYTGSEIIFVKVENQGQDKQVVTLYIDQDDPPNGLGSNDQTLLTLTRTFDQSTKQASIAYHGYGPYAYYRPSMMSYLATGLLLGYYTTWNRPIYRNYYTRSNRISSIRRSRSTYRKSSAWSRQKSRTRKLNANFRKNAPSSMKKGARKWAGKSSGKGSFYKGSRKATSSTKSSTSRSSTSGTARKSFSSSSRNFGSRRSSSSSRRSSGGRRRR